MNREKFFRTLRLSLFFFSLFLSSVRAETYKIDPAHTSINFTVPHLMVSETSGTFNEVDGTIEFDLNNLSATQIDVTIQVNSLDTNNADRDKHLKTGDFFDAATYPTITFKSKKISEDGTIVGDLTIRGVTKEINIPAKFSGPVQSPFEFKAIGIKGGTTINRQDFGITWNKQLDQGGLMIGDDVAININVEAHSQ